MLAAVSGPTWERQRTVRATRQWRPTLDKRARVDASGTGTLSDVCAVSVFAGAKLTALLPGVPERILRSGRRLAEWS